MASIIRFYILTAALFFIHFHCSPLSHQPVHYLLSWHVYILEIWPWAKGSRLCYLLISWFCQPCATEHLTKPGWNVLNKSYCRLTERIKAIFCHNSLVKRMRLSFCGVSFPVNHPANMRDLLSVSLGWQPAFWQAACLIALSLHSSETKICMISSLQHLGDYIYHRYKKHWENNSGQWLKRNSKERGKRYNTSHNHHYCQLICTFSEMACCSLSLYYMWSSHSRDQATSKHNQVSFLPASHHRHLMLLHQPPDTARSSQPPPDCHLHHLLQTTMLQTCGSWQC